jgi:DNA-binding LytR/AlgR family response regulator
MKEYKNRFLVKLGESISSIKTEEINYFISEDGLVLLVNKQGKRYPVDYNLDQLEQILNPDLFFRINRKIILNIESVKKISNYFNGRLILQIDHLEGDNAIVSRDRVGDFKGWLS